MNLFSVLSVEKNDVPELAMLTDMLQLTELKDRCVQLMTDEIDINNCTGNVDHCDTVRTSNGSKSLTLYITISFEGMFEFARKFHCEVLQKKAASIIQHRFPAVCRSEDFMSLSSEFLGEIISWNNLVLGKTVWGCLFF